MLVEFRDETCGAHLVAHLFTERRLFFLFADLGREVDHAEVASGDGAVDVNQHTVGFTSPGNLGFDFIVSHDWRRNDNRQVFWRLDRCLWTNQDRCLEHDEVIGLVRLVKVEFSGVDWVNGCLLHALRVEVRQCLTNGLKAKCLGATHSGLEDLNWHLSGAEAWQSCLTSHLLFDVVQRGIRLRGVDFDAELDAEILKFLCSCSHRRTHLIGKEPHHRAHSDLLTCG